MATTLTCNPIGHHLKCQQQWQQTGWANRLFWTWLPNGLHKNVVVLRWLCPEAPALQSCHCDVLTTVGTYKWPLCGRSLRLPVRTTTTHTHTHQNLLFLIKNFDKHNLKCDWIHIRVFKWISTSWKWANHGFYPLGLLLLRYQKTFIQSNSQWRLRHRQFCRYRGRTSSSTKPPSEAMDKGGSKQISS